MTLETATVLIPFWSPRPHNPQFSRSIIYNVITVRLTGHSSCSPPCVASINFWLVNDCLFFAGHMESELYSWTVIGLHCCRAPCHTGNELFFLPKWLQFAILPEDCSWSFSALFRRPQAGETGRNESQPCAKVSSVKCLYSHRSFCHLLQYNHFIIGSNPLSKKKKKSSYVLYCIHFRK